MQTRLHRAAQATLGQALFHQGQSRLHQRWRGAQWKASHHGPAQVYQSVAIGRGLGRGLGSSAVSGFGCRLLAHLVAQGLVRRRLPALAHLPGDVGFLDDGQSLGRLAQASGQLGHLFAQIQLLHAAHQAQKAVQLHQGAVGEGGIARC